MGGSFNPLQAFTPEQQARRLVLLDHDLQRHRLGELRVVQRTALGDLLPGDVVEEHLGRRLARRLGLLEPEPEGAHRDRSTAQRDPFLRRDHAVVLLLDVDAVPAGVEEREDDPLPARALQQRCVAFLHRDGVALEIEVRHDRAVELLPRHLRELLEEAVYGLPEVNRERIKNARLVANPGCYPTTVILGTAPFLKFPEVDTSCPVVDAKSGISGAGRGAKNTTSFCESGEGFKPYGVIGHRHIPEMEQELSNLAGTNIKVRFTPHLMPASRGMVSTIYLRLKSKVSAKTIREAFIEFYRDEPFIRILSAGTYPDSLMVRGSNQVHIAVEVDERTQWVVAMVAIDNLVKGASGQALQNMNLMMGIEETTGLAGLPMFP